MLCCCGMQSSGGPKIIDISYHATLFRLPIETSNLLPKLTNFTLPKFRNCFSVHSSIFRMFDQKSVAVLFVVSPAIILGGFLAQYSSYPLAGVRVHMVGFIWMLLGTLCKFMLLHSGADRVPKFKERSLYDLGISLVKAFGSLLSMLGVILLGIMETSAYVWVGVVGSFIAFIGGLAYLFKQLWIEQLEREWLLQAEQESK
ncbi:uncharacterized protein LOC110715550 [Chenopodium quinoa]|uniref:uncharacterized protein LOC110715550 n=1 Tax=Chenopodium quinoa TaxID=63459 RepID=UPI000B781718|nr:uncharacterized protein LOC110715550 [Chenopodium quinoa]